MAGSTFPVTAATAKAVAAFKLFVAVAAAAAAFLEGLCKVRGVH